MTSPRLSAVHNQADADALWAEVAATGTPLIEDDGRLLTFLWRDDGATENVVIAGGPAIWQPIEDDMMVRLAGTDVWHRTYSLEPGLIARYVLSPNDSLEPSEQVTDWVARERTFRADPLNPRVLHWPENLADPGEPAHDVSVIALRDVAPIADTVAANGFEQRRFPSVHLGNERRIWVRVPEPADTPPRLVVMLDGWVWACALPIGPVVDRAEQRTGPLVVVMVESLDEETRDRELSCQDAFVRFLAEELVPWLSDAHGVTERAAIVGQSLGGLAAVHATLTAPETFVVAGAQSGSFWWPRDESDHPHEELTALALSIERTDVRFNLETGALEGDEMIQTAERMRDALLAQGYPVDYRMINGGHDWLRWHADLGALLERMHS